MSFWRNVLKGEYEDVSLYTPDKTDKTDKTPQVSEVKEVIETSPFRQNLTEPDKTPHIVRISSDVRPASAPRHPNPVRTIMERLEGDMERYADALRTYGPMSYGQAMNVLGWGATRAGCAESDLRAAGRIAFNQIGRAYLVDEEAGHDE